MVSAWVLLSAILSLAGWVFSYFGVLSTASYAWLTLGLLILLVFSFRRSPLHCAIWRRSLKKLEKRFRRGRPRLYAVLALLALLGALIYAPNNHDALSYRVPRMLHWLADGGWNWLDVTDSRMNSRTCVTEWTLMPLLALTHSDRLFWIPSFLCFLLLPGLFFRIFRIAGVRRRVAWEWMWVLPMGYGFILQAGSIANDLPGAVFGLAAVDFAFRASRTQSFRLLMLSMISAALLTGAKTSNAPLLLAWLILFSGSFRLGLSRPVIFIFFALWGLVISFLPTALLNVKYCGDWTGFVLERVGLVKDPITGIAGNTFGLIVENIVPPVFPLASWWNSHVIESMPPQLHQHILKSFEALYGHVWELQQEEIAGLGFAIMLLICACLTSKFWAVAPRRIEKQRPVKAAIWWALVVAPWVSLLAYMSRAGIYPAARILLPYYPFLLIAFLKTRAVDCAIKDIHWPRLVKFVFLTACLVLILTPSRPLWPFRQVLGGLESKFPNNYTLKRAKNVYSAYAIRHDLFAPLISALPPAALRLGWISGGAGLETDLWRPFGSRVVERALISDTAESLLARGIHFIVMNRNQTPQDTDLAAWLQTHHAIVIAEEEALLTQAKGLERFTLLRLDDAPPGGRM